MVIYQGPSRIDGKQIVAIVTGNSTNIKTGQMLQVWILRADISPVEAVQTKQDKSICGDCKLRHNLGGWCYVQPFQAPNSIYGAWLRGKYDRPRYIKRMERDLTRLPIRLGAYGDPCAVPFHVWEGLIAQGCKSWSGYTHGWQNKNNQDYKQLLMASCDSINEANKARAMGWRYFLVTSTEDQELPNRTIVCLNKTKDMTCSECSICDGSRADSREVNTVSVAIAVHGVRAKRFLNVVR